jgi:hypothetical protein
MPKPPHSRGFSLILSLTIMAGIVMLVITLSSFITIESRAAMNQQLAARARLNGILAMRLALAHLQQEAGPDRRATARAEIIQPTTSIAALRNPMWTGIWRTDRPDQPPAWLVSGRHDRPAGAQSISLSGLADYDNDHLSPLQASPPAGIETVTLVGGASANRYSATDPTRPDGFVEGVAKLSIPEATGSYAYWIGDEGVKARLNLQDPREAADRLTPDHVAMLRAPGRAAHELLPGLENITQTDISRAAGIIDLTLTPGFAGGTPPDEPGRASTPNSRRLFHDVTFHSAGVIADSRDGGLRRDLSLAFELSDKEFNQSEFGSGFDVPATRVAGGQEIVRMQTPIDGRIIQVAPIFNRRTAQGELRGPTWWALRDYHRLYKQLGWSAAGVPSLRARALYPNAGSIHNLAFDGDNEGLRRSQYLYAGAHNADHAGLNPAVSDYGDFFGSDYRPIPRPFACSAAPYVDKTTLVFDVSQGGGWITLNVTPFVVLHNPYNVAIECPAPSGGASHVFSYSDWDDWKLIMRVTRFGFTTNYEHPLGDYYKRMGLRTSTTPDMFRLYLGNVTLQPGEYRVYSPESPFASVWGQVVRLTNSFNFTGGYTDGGTTGLDWGVLWPGFNLWSSDRVQFEIAPTGRSLPDAFGILRSVPTSNRITPAGVFRSRHGLVCWPEDVLTNTSDSYELFNRTSEINEVTHRVIDPARVGHPGPITFPNLFSIPSNRTATGQPAPGQMIAALELSTRSVTERVPSTSWLSSVATSALPFPPYTAAASLYQTAPAAPMFTHTNPTAPVVRSDGAGRVTDGANQGFNGSSPSYRMRCFRPSGSGSGPWSTLIATQVSGGSTLAYGGFSKEVTGTTKSVHLEIPLAPPVSLGQYAHANFGLRDQQPLYGVGNSFASLQVRMTKAHEMISPDWTEFDQPYLLNDAIWDAFFLSSAGPEMTRGISPSAPVPPAPDAEEVSNPYAETRQIGQVLDEFSAGQRTLLNPRMRLDSGNPNARDALRSHRKSAAALLNLGAFNVNSVSVDAWTAFLGSANRVAYANLTASQPNTATGTQANVRLPRALQTGPSPAATGAMNETGRTNWQGFANLNETQIRALATAIVAENKARFQVLTRTEREQSSPPAPRVFAGQTTASTPYLSLAEFVNRFLCTETWAARCGALQSAIFRADATGAAGLSDRVTAIAGVRFPAEVMVNQASLSGANAAPLNQPQNVEAFEQPVSGAGTNRVHAAMGAPGNLIQIDLLQSLGSSIATRSDTFVIRAFGEADDGQGAKASSWIEAVVQRVPEFITADNATETRPEDPAFTAVNRLLGRRFKLISYQWLQPDEI